jgi:protein required for attachment to host cells
MKSEVCVITVDASRARFFALEVTDAPPHGRLTRLVEVADLANAGRRQREGEMFSSSRPGLNSAPGGFSSRGVQHGTDDRRTDHIDELDRRFAVDIADELSRQVAKLDAQRAVIVANPTMLGQLRTALSRESKLTVEVSELKKELSWQSPVEVHDRLAEEGLLPPRGRLERDPRPASARAR